MSTRLLTLSQKTGKARFFFNLHCFIHFVCSHFGSGQPVSFGAVFSFTQVDSTNYCLTRKQRVALMVNPGMANHVWKGQTVPLWFKVWRCPPGGRTGRQVDRRGNGRRGGSGGPAAFTGSSTVCQKLLCLPGYSPDIFVPLKLLAHLKLVVFFKKRKKIIAQSQLYWGLNLFIL